MKPASPWRHWPRVGRSEGTGTTISFKPDLTIFTEVTEFEFEQINTRVRETAFLNAGLMIAIADERSEEGHKVVEHHYAGRPE